jgi:demethylmenaquinone methyltransferase/2-methoxy-6-polyprenyl-1,4-benzoquinol methylase
MHVPEPRHVLDALSMFGSIVTRAAPNRRRAEQRYGAMADEYELRTLSGDPWRQQLVARLAPHPGETIVDIGCGTGRNFERIQRGIGPGGRLIGVEPSAAMLAQARARVERHGWTNVDLVVAGAEEAAIPALADAALLCATHDVLRSRAALENVLRHVRPGGRIVVGGAKWAPWRRSGALSLNLATWRMNRDCTTTFEGFARPWSRLAELVPELHVEELYLGSGYLASATLTTPVHRFSEQFIRP